MRIIDNADTSVEFSAIKVGDCFYYDNCLFIKIEPVLQQGCNRILNAFCFLDNRITDIPNTWNVTPVNAEIIIRSKGVE